MEKLMLTHFGIWKCCMTKRANRKWQEMTRCILSWLRPFLSVFKYIFVLSGLGWKRARWGQTIRCSSYQKPRETLSHRQFGNLDTRSAKLKTALYMHLGSYTQPQIRSSQPAKALSFSSTSINSHCCSRGEARWSQG